MQATEALTRIIEIADKSILAIKAQTPEPELQEHIIGESETAVAICQAMLNTALPVTRFRCFVRIESGKAKGREYTLCGVRIEDIVAALYPLTSKKTDVYVLLFEQRATGADALDGYQGTTKTFTRSSQSHFANYLESLRKYAELAN